MRTTSRFTTLRPFTALIIAGALALSFLSTPPSASAGTPSSMALGLSWKGYATTTLKFSDFFSSNHTISLRFMPQFPHAYEGPLIGENGTGRFVIGQGDYSAGTNGTKLMLAVGSKSQSFPAALQAGKWHHLAMVASADGAMRDFTLYLDGSKLGTLTVAANDAQMPSGALRFGKRTTGQTVGGRNAQFYGLLDDVAVFDRALSTSEVQDLKANVLYLTGNEADLVAGFTFDVGTLPSTLTKPFGMGGSARRVPVSANRNSTADAKVLPLPDQHVEMTLPFPAGEVWHVVQGCDSAVGSHQGYASFCWDFSIADKRQSGLYPNGSNGAPFYAAAPGEVATRAENGGSGPGTKSNRIRVEQAPGEFASYLHLQQYSAHVDVGDTVTRHQELALTGDSGVAVGAHHLHFGGTDKPDGGDGAVTFPIAFSNYEVRDASGHWKRVFRGMPNDDEDVRRPLDPTARYNAVWRRGTTKEIKLEGWSFQDYKATYDGLWPQGWRLFKLQPYVNGDQVLYNAVWRPSTSSETQIYGVSFADYKSKYDQLWPKGWRLSILQAYVLDGQVLYDAVWRPSLSAEIQAYGVSFADYKAKYDSLWPQGWRLLILQSYVLDGQTRYNAVWRPSTSSEIQAYGVSFADYKTKYDQLWPKGWRLLILQSYVLNGQTRYNAVWRRSTADEIQAYGASYADYQKKDDELRAKGWRLYLLDAYQP